MLTQSSKTQRWSLGSGMRTASLAVAIVCLAASCVSSYSSWLGDANGGTGGNNQAPTAQLGVYPNTGAAPLTVQHDATGSWDSDGTIVSYDWDFDGDGTFEITNGEALPAEYTYSNAGTYTATVRVTDNGGASAAATATVTATGAGGGNQAPVAQIAVTPSSGPAPLTVSLHAGDSYDPDGTIASYDWDCDCDGDFEIIGGGEQLNGHIFSEPGVYHPRLRITDDDGHATIATTEVIVTSGELPPPDELPELAIAKWQGGAEAALSLTFDDGTPEHWTRGLPLWEEYGFCVTLGIVARAFQDAPERLPQLQQAFDAGHELANHSSTHPDFTTLTGMMRRNEVATCQQLLVNNVDGLDRVLTFIYPYEQFNTEITDMLFEMGYFFARSGYQGISDYASINDAWDPPFLHLYSWANQAELPMWMWDSVVDAVITDGGWQVEQCHGIGALGETGVGWSPRPEAEYRAHYDHIASYGDRLWVAPVGEVGLYIVERNNAEFIVLEHDETTLSFIVTDALDNEIFNVPLTVDLELPAGWSDAHVRQGTVTLDVSAPDPEHLRFDVTPGGGMVVVEQN